MKRLKIGSSIEFRYFQVLNHFSIRVFSSWEFKLKIQVETWIWNSTWRESLPNPQIFLTKALSLTLVTGKYFQLEIQLEKYHISKYYFNLKIKLNSIGLDHNKMEFMNETGCRFEPKHDQHLLQLLRVPFDIWHLTYWLTCSLDIHSLHLIFKMWRVWHVTGRIDM